MALICMIIRQKGFSLRPAAGSRALQLIDLLDEHAIHGLMYVDNAMVYERPTGHVVRTSNWALSCLKRSVRSLPGFLAASGSPGR